jgi:hypothetical protein
MSNDPILPSIESMHAGDHYCGIYRTDEDQRRLIVDFVRAGLERHEKMMYLVNIHSGAQLAALLEDAGIDVTRLVDAGQLIIMTAKDAYLADGQFEPERMIALLGTETQKALDEGYAALRVTGEMTWALAGEPGSERLIEYESLLNSFFPGRQCYAICQYDRRRFDSEMLLDILCTHPKVLYGRDGFDNRHMYYVPPVRFLGGDRQSAMLDSWLGNLSRPGNAVRG